MPKTFRPYKLSPMTGGIHTVVSDAKDDQAVAAENVVNDKDGLRRRPSFSAFQISGRFNLPTGQVYVHTANYTTDTITANITRGINITGVANTATALSTFGASSSGNVKRIFIGCDSQFQGVYLYNYISSFSAATAPFFSRIRFVTADISSITTPSADVTKYVSAKWTLDTTIYVDGSSASYRSPWHSPGYITWHKNSQPTEWDTKRTVNGVSAYWIILDVATTPKDSNQHLSYQGLTGDSTYDLDYASTYANSSTWMLEEPYLFCFTLHPVTGIFPLADTDRNAFIVSSMRDGPYGQETGPQLCLIPSEGHVPNRELILTADYGAAFVGTYGGPAVWTTTISLSSTFQLKKIDNTYNWTISSTSGGVTVLWGQWGLPIIATGVSPNSGATTTSFSFTLPGSYDTEFNDCLFYCTVSGTSGPVVDKYNRVKSSTVSGNTVTVNFMWEWDAAPPTDSDFTILGIPYKLQVVTDVDNPSAITGNMPDAIFDITKNDSSDASTITTSLQRPNSSGEIQDRLQLPTYVTSMCQFNIGKEPRYVLPAEPYPSYTYDTVTGETLFAFGNYPIQKWDGIRMIPLTCLSSEADLVVQEFRGRAAARTAIDKAGEQEESLPDGTLRTVPPRGQYIICFASRIFVAGIPGYANTVAYSAASVYNDIWPLNYSASIRNPEGDAITGMSTLNDELIVFTNSAIYAAPPPDDLGQMNFSPRAQGIGFINNRCVQRVSRNGSSWLIGANNDGIYSFNGSEPVAILKEWTDVIPEGVNHSALYTCCAAVSLFENCYYLAVPSSVSAVPDKIVRYNYNDGTFYVYSAPFGGVTAITRNYDADGNEELIFGHEDGTLSRFSDNAGDDGEDIVSYAKTKPFTAGGLTMAVAGYMVTLEHSEDLTIKEFLDEDDGDPNTLFTGDPNVIDYSVSQLGSLTLNTNKPGSDRKKACRIPSKAGTRAHTVQLEISSTGPRWKVRNIEVLQKPLGQRSKGNGDSL